MDDAVPRSLLFICLLLAGGFFAGTETALSYCNRIRMQVLADDGDKRAKRVVSILDQFDRAVVTLLIAINVIYTTAASVATIVAVNAVRPSPRILRAPTATPIFCGYRCRLNFS